MKKPLTITIPDYINFQIEGLTKKELDFVKKKTSYPVKGAYTSAAYKAKIWDGRESFLDDDGIGYQKELNSVLDALETLGYDLDRDVNLDIHVETPEINIPFVDKDYLKDIVGFDLRDYQYSSINATIEHRNGILDIGTNGGKSLICLGISRAFDPIMKSLVIVPSDYLLNQTLADYKKSELDVIAISASTPPKKREEIVRSHRHVIITSKLFMNISEYFEHDTWVVMIDEAHICGEVFEKLVRTSLSHCPVRIGLTATLPKTKDDPYKRQRILNIIGGDIITSIRQKELISRGISSKLSIRMFETTHAEIEEIEEKLIDWSVEENYLLNNKHRLEAIANFIKKFDVKNTLILCHRAAGLQLGELLGCNVIVDDTPNEHRREWFAQFDTRDDYILIGTYGCVGTGISANRIFRQFSIDVGKNRTYILQGIGRGLRRDGVHNEVEFIDISARMKYSKRHRLDRIKIYKEEEFDWAVEKQPIVVVGD